MKIPCYEGLGKIQCAQNDHHAAMRLFKKMMLQAWFDNDSLSEIKAYGHIGTCYFYLGDLEKCEFYNHRYLHGRTENHLSIPKQAAINQIKQKRLLKYSDPDRFRLLKSAT